MNYCAKIPAWVTTEYLNNYLSKLATEKRLDFYLNAPSDNFQRYVWYFPNKTWYDHHLTLADNEGTKLKEISIDDLLKKLNDDERWVSVNSCKISNRGRIIYGCTTLEKEEVKTIFKAWKDLNEKTI